METQARTLLVSEPGRGYDALRDEIDAAVAMVLRSGWYVLGQEVAAFERAFAEYVGCRHAVGVASGTDALRVALLACGIGPGDEVLTVANAGEPTPMAICSVGATPRFVDVDPSTYTMSAEEAARAVGPRAKALLPVHLYGLPADLGALKDLASDAGIRLVEDACQAHGAAIDGQRAGGVGDAGCFSFYPTKNLGALGDGGMVVTDDDELADRARLVRQYGWQRRNWSVTMGINSRLDELQAAILRVKLPHLDAWNARRREIAARYTELLEPVADQRGLQLTVEPPGRRHVYHLFVVRAPARDRLRDALSRRGIAAGVHYPHPAHLQPAFQHLWDAPPRLPVTERLAQEVLSLPIFPEMTDDEVDSVAYAVATWAMGDPVGDFGSESSLERYDRWRGSTPAYPRADQGGRDARAPDGGSRPGASASGLGGNAAS